MINSVLVSIWHVPSSYGFNSWWQVDFPFKTSGRIWLQKLMDCFLVKYNPTSIVQTWGKSRDVGSTIYLPQTEEKKKRDECNILAINNWNRCVKYKTNLNSPGIKRLKEEQTLLQGLNVSKCSEFLYPQQFPDRYTSSTKARCNRQWVPFEVTQYLGHYGAEGFLFHLWLRCFFLHGVPRYGWVSGLIL